MLKGVASRDLKHIFISPFRCFDIPEIMYQRDLGRHVITLVERGVCTSSKRYKIAHSVNIKMKPGDYSR